MMRVACWLALLLVCLFAGECRRVSSCPLAHPGVRDAAVTKFRAKMDKTTGKKVKSAYVYVCMDINTGIPHTCALGSNCQSYHVYVRPSTQELIARIYPTAEGTRYRTLPGGTTINGKVKHGEYNG